MPEKCTYCPNPADGHTMVDNIPICFDCLFNSEEYGKLFPEYKIVIDDDSGVRIVYE